MSLLNRANVALYDLIALSGPVRDVTVRCLRQVTLEN